jgi:cytochrome oxidase Cu insertion factor (SCO1/SenC/PrrC family)
MKIYRILYFILTIVILSQSTVHSQPNYKKSNQKATVSGTYHDNSESDTLTLILWDKIASVKKKLMTPLRQFKAVVTNGNFSFKIDSVKLHSYFSIGKGKFRGNSDYFLDLLVIEPGDNIQIEIFTNNKIEQRDKIIVQSDDAKAICLNCENFNFSGNGSLKDQLRWELYKAKDSLQNNWYDTVPIAQKEARSFMDMSHRSYSQMMFVKERELNILKSYESRLSAGDYQLVKADAIGRCNDLFLVDLATSYDPKIVKVDDQLAFKKFYSDTVLIHLNDSLPDSVTAISAYYPSSLINKTRLQNKLFLGKSNYSLLKRNFQGLLRERLLTNYLYESLNKTGVDSLIVDALTFIKDPLFEDLIKSAQASTKIGNSLDFTLQDITGKNVSLSGFKGKVVFIDFWFIGCGGCASFYQERLSKVETFYRSNPNVVFISICIDPNSKTWLRGIKSGMYTSLDAINLNTGIMGVTHPLIKTLSIVDYPGLFIVGKKGDVINNNSSFLRACNAELLINVIGKYL